MRIGHPWAPMDGEPIDNIFEAYDDAERHCGTCVVYERMVPALFPRRPRQIVIHAEGDDLVLDLLYGAAFARAQQMLRAADETAHRGDGNPRSEPVPARIYAEVAPDDRVSRQILATLGFVEEDDVIRMRRKLVDPDFDRFVRLPAGCSIVRDRLGESIERKYFLERYNALYGITQDQEWLDDITTRDHFARLLLASQEGLAGELLVWQEGDVGVLGILQTVMCWRRRGVASYLVNDALHYFRSLGVKEVIFDVWTGVPGTQRLAEKFRFSEQDCLVLYPSMKIG